MNGTENGPAVPAAGWVAVLVGAGLSLGALVAWYDANLRTLGLVIFIYGCVYVGAYIFAQWYEARHFRFLHELDPKLAEDWARRYEETLYYVWLILLIPLVALVSMWVGKAIFGLLSSAPTPGWVIALTGALLLVVGAALERPAVQPTATSHAGDRIWRVLAVGAVIIVLGMVISDDDTPASATETAQAAPTTETISTPLSFGDSGPDVVNLQERLAAEGLPVTADGVYGPETADAVLAFQEQEQLTIDGVVGSETAEALGISSG
jgi:hypothetical protein